VSKTDGLVYPCDPGCCGGKCENRNPNISRIETRPSAGVSLPDGYGLNLPQSDQPSAVRGAADFQPPTHVGSNYKVWQLLLIAFLPLILVLVMAFFLT
jgi:hypothetical protein